MGRGKLRMGLINSEKSRRTTFQKRRKGLLRKAYELSTLCDVGTCVIVYGPKQKLQPLEIQTWPPNQSDVERLINLYKVTENRKRVKKSFDLHDFFSDRKKKIEVEILKVKKDALEAKYPKWDDSFAFFSEDELGLFMDNLDSKIDIVRRRIDIMRGASQYFAESGTSSEIMLGGFYQASQNPNNFMQSYFDEKKPIFVNPLNAQFPYQIPHEQTSQMLVPNNPIYSTNLPTLSTINGLNYSSGQFFGGYSNPSDWYNDRYVQDPSFSNLPMIGMFNDPSSSIGHYPLPPQSTLPSSTTYNSDFEGISSQMNISDQMNNDSDYFVKCVSNEDQQRFDDFLIGGRRKF